MSAVKASELGMTAPTLPAVSTVGAGVGLGAIAFALFTAMDALIKWLSAEYPVHQLVFSNALFALVPVVLVSLRRGGLSRLRTRRLRLHVVRGLLGAGGGLLAFYAYSQLPLADAYAIIFTTPLMITALSLPVLGEPVGWRRWSAVAVGFAGVLIMLRPGSRRSASARWPRSAGPACRRSASSWCASSARPRAPRASRSTATSPSC